MQKLLQDQELSAPENTLGRLDVALTDTPDNFLRIAKEALQLEIGQVKIRELQQRAATGQL